MGRGSTGAGAHERHPMTPLTRDPRSCFENPRPPPLLDRARSAKSSWGRGSWNASLGALGTAGSSSGMRALALGPRQSTCGVARRGGQAGARRSGRHAQFRTRLSALRWLWNARPPGTAPERQGPGSGPSPPRRRRHWKQETEAWFPRVQLVTRTACDLSSHFC